MEISVQSTYNVTTLTLGQSHFTEESPTTHPALHRAQDIYKKLTCSTKISPVKGGVVVVVVAPGKLHYRSYHYKAASQDLPD